MAMVRTRRLAVGRFQPVVTELPTVPRIHNEWVYQCPAGYRAIVRDIRLSSFDGGDLKRDIRVQAAVSGVGVGLFYYFDIMPARWIGGLVCDVVLNSGDGLILYADVNSMEWIISGAELLL